MFCEYVSPSRRSYATYGPRLIFQSETASQKTVPRIDDPPLPSAIAVSLDLVLSVAVPVPKSAPTPMSRNTPPSLNSGHVSTPKITVPPAIW